MKMSLKDKLSSKKTTIVPGVFDALSAKLAAKAGAEIVALTGFSVSATQLGEPDIGLLTQSDVIHAAKIICDAVDIPVIVDGDTGYGGPLNVIKLVKELCSLGASGVILEDQKWPKRCGHMQGKEVISAEEHIEKLKAARFAAQGKDFTIVARTDSRATHGIQEALRRGIAYAEAGADVVFIEAPQSKEEIECISETIKAPLLINMIEGGRTPLMSKKEIEKLGFALITYPLTALLSATKAMEVALSNLIKFGNTDNFLVNGMMTFDEFNTLIQLEEKQAIINSFRG